MAVNECEHGTQKLNGLWPTAVLHGGDVEDCVRLQGRLHRRHRHHRHARARGRRLGLLLLAHVGQGQHFSLSIPLRTLF